MNEEPLLDPATVASAEALGIFARFVVEGYMAGDHASPFRGFAVEFTQHREYAQGDDLRHLDYKVLARTDRNYIKQYEMETNFVAQILVDGSRSMRYGSGPVSKLHGAKALAACLCHVILNQRDAVELAVFDESEKSRVNRTGNPASMRAILETLAAFDPTGETRVGRVLNELAGRLKRKGIVILISDLFDDEEELLKGVQHLRFGGNEVIVFHCLDPYELDFPFTGMVEFENLEGEDKLKTSPKEIRLSYLREMKKFCDRIREGCEANNAHYVLFNTGKPLRETLGAYLAFRRRTSAR